MNFIQTASQTPFLQGILLFTCTWLIGWIPLFTCTWCPGSLTQDKCWVSLQIHRAKWGYPRGVQLAPKELWFVHKLLALLHLIPMQRVFLLFDSVGTSLPLAYSENKKKCTFLALGWKDLHSQLQGWAGLITGGLKWTSVFADNWEAASQAGSGVNNKCSQNSTGKG